MALVKKLPGSRPTERRNGVTRARCLVVGVLALGVGATYADGVAAASRPTPGASSPCTTHVVSLSSTAGQIRTAISAAATETTHPRWAVGPTGDLQGVVYFQQGVYALAPITFLAAQSNVRLVFDPGVELRPAPGTTQDLFSLGTASSRTTNVSFMAGDGCGTVNYPPSDLSHVWLNTNHRGNQPGIYRHVDGGYVAGMPNIDIGDQLGWPRSQLATMWVLDLDPAGETGSGDDFDPAVAGFRVTNAKGVGISDVVSYQNAARLVNADGTPHSLGEPNGARVPGVTSATTVVMIEPDWASYSGPTYPAPTNVSISDVYDVLAPSGWGPEQVRVCQGCHFDAIFSHGGTAMRFETDGGGSSTDPQHRACGGTGVSGTASGITGVYGNVVVSFTPHCRANGAVTVTGVRGFSDSVLVFFGKPERDGAGFTKVTVDTVTGCGSGSAKTAQDPMPDLHTYVLAPSADAVNTPQPYTFGAGFYRWPDTGAGDAGGLPTDVPSGATYQRSSAACQ